MNITQKEFVKIKFGLNQFVSMEPEIVATWHNILIRWSIAHMKNNNINVVGCGESVVYLTSLGHPIDIGLQLGKACYPCSR